MDNSNANYARFEKLRMRNYGVFNGDHEFTFDRQNTKIVGCNGCGTTTLFNALAKLGPVDGVHMSLASNNEDMVVDVSTSGNREFLKKYNKLIFIGEDRAFYRDSLETDIIDQIGGEYLDVLRGRALTIFHEILVFKPHKIRLHKDFNACSMATGEAVCRGVAYLFAAREILGLDLPIVFDSLYGPLDSGNRHGVSDFLQKQQCQIILLGNEPQFTEVGDCHYTLDNPYKKKAT